MEEAKPYHHPDLRRALLDAALNLLREEGVKGFSMRKLAALAGVSHSAAYRHFASKDAILAELMLEAHKGLKSALETARAAEASLASREGGRAPAAIMALMRAYVRFGRENPEHLALMFSAEGFDALGRAARAGARRPGEKPADYDAFSVLEDAIKESQADGGLAPGIYSGVLGFLLWSTVHGFSILRNAGVIGSLAAQRGWDEASAIEAFFEAAGTQLGLSAGMEKA